MLIDGQEAKRAVNLKHILGVYFFNVIYHTNISAELHMQYSCMSKETLKKSFYLRMVEVHPLDLCIVALNLFEKGHPHCKKNKKNRQPRPLD